TLLRESSPGMKRQPHQRPELSILLVPVIRRLRILALLPRVDQPAWESLFSQDLISTISSIVMSGFPKPSPPPPALVLAFVEARIPPPAQELTTCSNIAQ